MVCNVIISYLPEIPKSRLYFWRNNNSKPDDITPGLMEYDGNWSKLNIMSLNKDDCMQEQLVSPSRESRKRNRFWAEYSSKGFEFVAKKYSRYGVINDFKHIIYPLYKKILKK